MILCEGCGFNVEKEDVVECNEGESLPDIEECKTCKKCNACPDMKESYRRGFNSGLGAMYFALTEVVRDTYHNLMRHKEQ